jgi:hypothetical protein
MIFFVQVFLYTMPDRATQLLTSRAYLIRSAATVAASVVCALLASSSAPVVQAAILDRRLKQAVENRKPEVASTIIEIATDSHIALNRRLVANATTKFAGDTTQGAWNAYLAMVNYTTKLRSLNWSFRFEPNLGPERLTSHPGNEPCGPENNVVIEPRAPGIVTCRLRLDGQSLSNTYLVAVTVDYDGGPVSLNQVRFLSTILEMKDTPNTRILARKLLESENNTITLEID